MPEQSPDTSGQQAAERPGPPVKLTVGGDDGDLADSVFALSTLSAARLSLEDLLTRVATFAVHAIPGADGAGLTLMSTAVPTRWWPAPGSSGTWMPSSTASTKARVSPPPRPVRRCGPDC